MTTRFLYILMALLALTSCGSDSPDIPQRPALDPPELNMLVGETLQLTVLHATDVSATLNSDIARISVYKNRIMVEALRPGDANIEVEADGRRLVCPLHIVDYGGSTTPADEAAAQLADPVSRFCSPEFDIRYDRPGTIVEVDNALTRISIASIATGDHAVLMLPASPVGEGPVDGCSLDVNGEDVPLASAEVLRLDPSGICLRLTTAAHNHRLYIVATDFD